MVGNDWEIDWKKDVKTFQFTAITRLPAVANALHIENEYKPTPTTFSLITQFKDKSKMEKMKGNLFSHNKKLHYGDT